MSSIENQTKRLGQQLERYRLMQNISQIQLAQESGIGERTLRRLESGQGGTLETLIRVLTALKLDDNLTTLIPDHRIRPIERARQSKNERQRATRSSAERRKTNHKQTNKSSDASAWRWGDGKS